MAIDVGMNYKHIDFHKGTHGYPIKNADDMMKPCPLMPDGQWIKIEALTTIDPSNTDNPFSHSVTINGVQRTDYYDETTGKRILTWASGATGVWNSQALCNGNYFCFAECRLSVEIDVMPNTAISLQGSDAWLIYTNGNQYYYCIRNINKNNVTNYWTDVAHVKQTLYAYVIPNGLAPITN